MSARVPEPSAPRVDPSREDGNAVAKPGAVSAVSAAPLPDHGARSAAPLAIAAAAVNTADSQASNTKLARQKEAEEDRQLIAKAQAGDMGSFRKLVERHQRRAFAIALGLVRDENDAREIVQDAFLRVFKGLANFQGSSSFFTWLYRIITNLSIDLIRKPGSKLAELDESRLEREEDQEALFPFVSRVDGADPLDVVRRNEIGIRLQKALESLPPYHRGVIVMREIEGLSYEEMAEAMAVSKGTIMSRLFHARQKLQRVLADCYEEQVGHRSQAHLDADGAEGPASGEGAS